MARPNIFGQRDVASGERGAISRQNFFLTAFNADMEI